MELTEWLVAALLIGATVASIVLVYALIEAVATLKAVRGLAADIHGKLPPLLDKAEVSVDAFNAEMLRLDAIISQVEEVANRVSSTASLVHDVVNVPSAAAGMAGERLRAAWSRMKRTRE